MGVSSSHLNSKERAKVQVPSWATEVIQFCSWHERLVIVPLLSKAFYAFLSEDHIYYILCMRLRDECGLFIYSTLLSNYSWRSLFRELYPLRSIFIRSSHELHRNNTANLYASTHKINVYSRFKPMSSSTTLDTIDIMLDKKRIVLPLHQRLSLIRLNNGFSSNKEAIEVLKSEGSWFGGLKSNNDSNQSLNEMKTSFDLTASVQSIDPSSGRVIVVTNDIGLREFSFTSAFPETASQREVFETVSHKLLMDVFNGYNATVLVYGQTGSGKSFTMFGKDDDSIFGGNTRDRGIIPRTFSEVLEAASERERNANIESRLFVSYIEIFGESVSDLLRGGSRCGHSKVAAQRYVLDGAAEKEIRTMADVSALLAQGEAQKKRAATAMNERSSRAHSMVIIKIKQRHGGSGVTLSSSLFLVDLGGSEQVKKSGIGAGTRDDIGGGFVLGDNMREAVYINLGLLALKKCIDSLNNTSSYVPYQDSKLTMLLSEGLGGNSKTSVIVCASMDSEHISETVSTLRFGESCAKIEKDVNHKSSVTEELLAKIDVEVKKLEQVIKAKELWEILEVVREDVNAEDGTVEAAVGKKEVMKVSVLKGAEAERKQLEALLRRRAEFTGKPLDTFSGDRKKVVGFGKGFAEAYGIGSRYDAEEELTEGNLRFESKVTEDSIPRVIKERKGAALWKSGEEIKADEDEALKIVSAPRAKKGKLVYSGLSA